MISVEKCKELLGDESLSDEEAESLRVDLYEMAQLAFETWMYEKSGSKNPVGLLTNSANKLE